MGWIVPVTVTPVVVIPSGVAGSGLFVYSGPPAVLGNLVAQIVAPGVVKDPFGNTVGAILNVGKWSPAGALLQHFGIDQNGKIYLADTTGLTRIFADPAIAALTVYNAAGAGAGNLVQSIASVAVADEGFGNALQGGITSYLSATFFANLKSGLLTFADTVNAAFAGGQVGLTTVTTSDDAIQLLSPLAISTDIQAGLVLQRAATPGPSHAIINNSDLNIKTDTAPAQPASGFSLHSSTGRPKVKSSASGDTTDYAIGHAITPSTSAINVTNAFVNLFGGLTVAASNYHVQAHLIVTVGGTATAFTFQLTGPAVGANTSVKWWLTIEAGGGQSLFAGHSLGSLASVTLPGGVNVGAGGICHIWMDAYLQFTASGTLNLQAEQTSAIGTSTAAIGNTLEVYPA